MLTIVTSAFSRFQHGIDYSQLPASVREEIEDAMSATSKTDIR